MKIHVSQVECAGHGQCAGVNEKLFPLDDDGFSAVDVLEVPEDLQQDARRGAESCPSQAISISDD